MLEKAQGALRTADRFVGKVRTMIRQSGVTAAFEHAMREDYSLYAGISGKIHPSQTTPLLTCILWLGHCTSSSSQPTFDVNLD